jgi:prepilin-type N-terminal cleavage/methylation domain-containing protein
MKNLNFNNRRGFTMVEMTISVVILSTAILALGSTTTSLSRISVVAENNALALQACEDRLARIRLHPIYQELDSLYTESGATIPGMDGSTRQTKITRIIREGAQPQKFVDFTRITVIVDGRKLSDPVSRTITIGRS